MAPTSRPEGHLSLGYLPQPPGSLSRSSSTKSSTSPVEPSTGNSLKSPFNGQPSMNGVGSGLGSARLGAGSPSHDLGGRLYSRRAREIQAQEGLSPGIWGPPTSGNSTPLQESIPESPTQDGFPDLIPPSEIGLNSPGRRARAGTVPSRFSPAGTLNGLNVQQSLLSKTSRPTPSTSPFKPSSSIAAESGPKSAPFANSNSALLSRLRAGSTPSRPSLLTGSNPFGSSLFSTGWTSSRDRTSTLASIRSSEDPTSPAQSSYSRDGLTDSDVKTLDYLGLAETPQQPRATLAPPLSEALLQQQGSTLPQLLAELDQLHKNANRFRSYSVNAKERYAADEEGDYLSYSGIPSGTLTPSAAVTAAQLAATQAQIHQHNLAVQAFANHASVSRPRARTAGIVDAPPSRSSLRNYLTPSQLDNALNASDLESAREYDGLIEAVQLMHLNNANGTIPETAEEGGMDGPTRALWIGSIPVSTTVTSLDAIFGRYGPIESTRVLTHKNCGFVNFERVESAVQAKALLNGKEIFPGAGPVRIGYAKVPTQSSSGTPGAGGIQPSPTPDPQAKAAGQEIAAVGQGRVESGLRVSEVADPLSVPDLATLQADILQIVQEFGASEAEVASVSAGLSSAIAYQTLETDIPPIPEPTHTRTYDAPRLRDIRKRIDNGSCNVPEIEATATDMLPEIAELASDYLGNTVVQKLFEFCSEEVRGRMLSEIAPHLAEIGVHKNGTWAAQKIIDVVKEPDQMSTIVTSVRPYTVPLFLDQYGNYVLQCCLRFGAPYNDFIFETMMSRMWEIAQGRFGARAMRACLESHHATKDQQRMLAAAVALHSVQLATNTNGALLLTWFLDTCTFPRRRTVLAPRLVPYLVHLCTHKVAYLTVLKVINQRNEPEAREIVLNALFFSPQDTVLEQILSDQSSGATLIFKVLTTPFFDEKMRSEIVQNVAKVLTRIKATPNQGYKRLMDEVGLSSRSTSSNGPQHGHHHHAHPVNQERGRPISQQANSSFVPQPPIERQFSNQFPPNMSANYDATTPDNAQFSSYGQRPVNSAVQQMTPQQMQYQSYLASSQRSSSAGPNGFVPGMNGAPTYGGYATPPASVEAYRNVHNHSSPLATGLGQMAPSPVMAQGSITGFPATQNYNPTLNNMGGMGVYGYPQQGFYPQHQMQTVQGGGRRGRR